MSLTWSAATMATGDPEIDRQHQDLFKHLNSLFARMQRGDGGKGLADLLAFVAKYVQTHFVHEEICMDAYRCPAAVANKTAHEEFLRLFADLRARIEAEGPTVSLTHEAQRELSSWMTRHVAHTDSQLGRCLKKTA